MKAITQGFVAALIVVSAASRLHSGATSSGAQMHRPDRECIPFQWNAHQRRQLHWVQRQFLRPREYPIPAPKYFSAIRAFNFTADQTYTVAAPNAQVTFDPTVSCATTSYDAGTNTFNTTVPDSGSDEIFLSGLAFPVPDSFANAGGRVTGPVTWQGTIGSDNSGVSVGWKRGAAV
jgi:hypothetical protein